MKRMLIIVLIGIIILTGLLVTAIFVKKVKEGKISPQPFLKEAQDALLRGDYKEARKLYKKAQEDIDDVNKLKEVQRSIEEANLKIIFSPIIDECSIKYVVKPADVLAKIAKEFNTTVDLIKRANNLISDVIRPGQELKINTCKFSIIIDKSQNLLFLKVADEIVKTYVVATGKNNSTPVGSFKIVNKLPNPTWFKTGAVIPSDSSENILGSRWMGFDLKGYGIHGTTEPQNLGRQVTMGCVRMKNEEVEELYDIVPIGTEVTIID
jgi:lipoprotein-anchoring transpeptidase ErfK/SrfK